jgi:hypothetical protein
MTCSNWCARNFECELLSFSFWDEHELSGSEHLAGLYIRGFYSSSRECFYSSSRELGFFAWEPDLNRLKLSSKETEQQAADPLAPPPRRPGPPPDTQRWFSICGEIARRCIDPKTGCVQVPKSEANLADNVLEWLEENAQGQPSVSEMREAVKRVCAALRTMQR